MKGVEMMKNKVLLLMIVTGLFLTACNNKLNDSNEDEEKDDRPQIGRIEEKDEVERNEEDTEVEVQEEVDDSPSEIQNESIESPLAKYSAAEIEYARIWLQLGANKEIEELYIEHIAAGEQLNPNDETSIPYEVDVVQLSGSRLIDGVITYSSNGNGTIYTYNIPRRWDGENPAGEEVYKEILENKALIQVDTGNHQEIIELIQKMKR